jgi:hypothetical protein
MRRPPGRRLVAPDNDNRVALAKGGCSMTRSTIVNKREFRVFAMKRSGHHAVINWLLLHFTGPVYFLNNCGFLVSKELFNFSPGCDRQDRPAPYREVCILAGTSSVYYNGGRVLEKFRHYRLGQECPSMLERLLEMERAERAAAQSMEFPATRDCYLFNIEDLDIRNVASVPFETAARGTSEAIQSIIVLRDPFNWIASRIKNSFAVSPSILQAWKSQVTDALGRTRYLSPASCTINYNRWLVDTSYRRDISLRLGLGPSDHGLRDVGSFGEGSSFDGRSYDGRADEMNVRDRWRHYRDDASFRAIFAADPELGQLSEEFFDFNPLKCARTHARDWTNQANAAICSATPRPKAVW